MTLLRRHAFFVIVIVYAGMWLVSHAPALWETWWSQDDYLVLSGDKHPVRRGLENGRPLEGLWLLGLMLDGTADQPFLNRPLRCLQGLLHALSAALLCRALARRIGWAAAALCALPFLLWPFASSATLWRTGGFYVIGAVLALTAQDLVRADQVWSSRRRWVAGGLMASAVLACQIAACIGLVCWLASTLLLQPKPWQRRAVLESAIVVGTGWLVGALLSYATVLVVGDGGTGRSTLGTDVLAKLFFVADLHRFYFASELYPRSVVVAHFGVVGLFALTVALRRKPRELLLFLLILITIHTAVLPVAENWLSWRTAYGGPLALVAALACILRPSQPLLVRGVAVGLTLFITAQYTLIARTNAAECVEVYRRDRAVLAALPSHPEPPIVAIAGTGPPAVAVRSWNPYGLVYSGCDAKLSAFLRDWSAQAFLKFHSDYPVLDAESLVEMSQIERSPTPGIEWRYSAANRAWCVLPP